MQVVETQHLTPEAYLEFETHAEERHEYRNGEMILMTGGTPNHNRIAGNLYAALNFALKRLRFEAFFTDQRLWIPEKQIYAYPDVMVVEGELQYQERRSDTITNPLMIAEVLSSSTEVYDRGDKFAAYRSISTFQEYVLIDQYTLHVEHFSRTEPQKWTFVEYFRNSDTLSLASVPFQISLAELYDKVVFSTSVESNG